MNQRKLYVGSKIILATPQINTDTNRPGYQVTYEDGYTSWSPKDVFEKAYCENGSLTSGMAIDLAQGGERIVRRRSWAQGKYLFQKNLNGQPRLFIEYYDGSHTLYTPTPEDLVAVDWVFFDAKEFVKEQVEQNV